MKFFRFSNPLKHLFKSWFPFRTARSTEGPLPVRSDWSKYLQTLMQDQVDEILKQFEVKWIKEQYILKQQLICKDDFTFKIPPINTRLRDPNKTIIESIDNTIEFITNYPDDNKENYNENENENENQNANILKYIGGVDISHGSTDEDMACAGLIVLEYPSLKQVYKKFKMVRYNKPYIAGFLAFREVNFLMEIMNEMKHENSKYLPQIILVDGNGILHHRGFGLASHFGVLSKIPTIGIGKNLLSIDGLDRKILKKQCDKCLMKKGDYIHLIGNRKDLIHGVALRCSKKAKNAMFVSIGHRVSLQSAIEIVLLTSIHKLPEPIRFADIGTREFIREYEIALKNKQQNESTVTQTK